jgi:hypothetical protein
MSTAGECYNLRHFGVVFLAFFLFSGSGVELRASLLLGRCPYHLSHSTSPFVSLSLSLSLSPRPSLLDSFKIGSHFLPRLALKPDPGDRGFLEETATSTRLIFS